ncbi:hypothetical protein AX15_005306 [Amanita polypyramis BW_CC]|nr:hypothetical protein AX15_005306 [Amanita polypyramis BW_CC]
MANAYAAQQNWQQRHIPYSDDTFRHLEQKYGYSSLPASSNSYDNTYEYTQHNSPNTTGGDQSPLTNDTTYPQSSPSHTPSYNNASSNQPIQGSGPYAFEYNGFSSQSVPDRVSYGTSSYDRRDDVSLGVSAISLMEENTPMANAHYLNSSIPQSDLGQSYLHETGMSQPFPYRPTNVGDSTSKYKRQRSGDGPDEQEAEQPENKEGLRPRCAFISTDVLTGLIIHRPGACSRCKTLKVKCEFKADTDSCKRCLNGNHECIIPGRKKRRAPPKREHLLNQIREQAAQIQKLMAQLEMTNKGTSERPPTLDLLSPLVSPIPPPSKHTGTETNGTRTPDHTKEAVAEWIAKAKESLDVFGDHINMAGAGMPRNLLAGHDQSDDEDGGYYTANDDDDNSVGIAIEHSDDGGESSLLVDRSVRNRDSASSLNSVSHVSKKLHGDEKGAIIPPTAAPFGLFGDMILKKRGTSVDPDEQEDKDVTGIANDNFFRSASVGNRLSSQSGPHIISHGLITAAEAETLFKIYFDNMNLSVSLLDPVLYTALNTFFRSPFLFTVICAVASRFYSKRPDLYQQVMHYAQEAAGRALISGKKDVDMCHAYILLSLYPLPAKRLEDQRSWLYLGLAIRVATELNLHLPVTTIPQEEKPAREVLNRTRVWINCFNLDRSTGGQYGKPPTINPRDYQANHSQDWWKCSPYNMRNFDIQICCYNHSLRTTASFVAKIYNDPESPTGLNQNAEFEKLAAETDDQLQSIREQWFNVILESTDPDDYQNKFRIGLLRVAFSYNRLIVLSYGFQHAFGKNNTDENPFLLRCLNAAQDVLHAVVDNVCGDPKMRVFWRHGPEAQSVFITFASAFLVKLLQPKFASYLSPEMRVDIRNKVQRVIDLLSSPDIAIDNSHGPKLYAKFLKGLLASPLTRLESQSPTSFTSSLPRRSVRKPKSIASPSSTDGAPTTSPTSATRLSLSPPPNRDALSFESFAPLRGAADPFAHGTAGVSAQNAAGLDMSTLADLFNPPLNIDNQIMDNFQTLGNAEGWTSYNWLSHYQTFQQNMGLDMRSAGEIIMQDDQYNIYGGET